MMKSTVRKQSGSKTPARISADAWQRRVDIARADLKNYAFMTTWRDLDATEVKVQAKTTQKLADLLANDPNEAI